MTTMNDNWNDVDKAWEKFQKEYIEDRVTDLPSSAMIAITSHARLAFNGGWIAGQTEMKKKLAVGKLKNFAEKIREDNK